MRYKIECYWEMCGNMEVEADNLAEALEKAMFESPLPTDEESFYIADSFEINMEYVENDYPEEFKGLDDKHKKINEDYIMGDDINETYDERNPEQDSETLQSGEE